MSNPKIKRLDAKQRAAEKQASRDRDAADLASGRKSREQLRKERSAFAFPSRIMWKERPLA